MVGPGPLGVVGVVDPPPQSGQHGRHQQEPTDSPIHVDGLRFAINFSHATRGVRIGYMQRGRVYRNHSEFTVWTVTVERECLSCENDGRLWTLAIRPTVIAKKGAPGMDETRTLLRHFLAALAYRTQKALRDAPPDFAEFRAGPKVRTPHELIRHMDSLLGYSRTLFIGGSYRAPLLPEFGAAVAHFHETLADVARHLGARDRAGRHHSRAASSGTVFRRHDARRPTGDFCAGWPEARCHQKVLLTLTSAPRISVPISPSLSGQFEIRTSVD